MENGLGVIHRGGLDLDPENLVKILEENFLEFYAPL